MKTPAYVLEFEKPLRELARQLDELRQRSIETNVDLAQEIGAIEKRIEAVQTRSIRTSPPGSGCRSPGIPRGPTRSIMSA